MKLAFDNGGQTANKFWIYISLLNSCLENKDKIYLLNYDKELKEYPNLINNNYLKFLTYNKFLDKHFYNIINKCIRSLFFNRFYNIVPLLAKTFPHKILNPWEDSSIDFPINNKFKELINEIFLPKKEIIKSVENQFEKYTNKPILGIHIRRGDYKNWRNGQYYYTFKDYNEYILKLLSLLTIECNIFICSNDCEFLKFPFDFKYFSIKNSSAVKDLFALSLCDYIIGPPSTYSLWASFFGQKKLAFIHNIQDINTTFKVVKSHNLYEDNSNIIFHKNE